MGICCVMKRERESRKTVVCVYLLLLQFSSFGCHTEKWNPKVGKPDYLSVNLP